MDFGDPEEIEMVNEIGPDNINELQKRKFVQVRLRQRAQEMRAERERMFNIRLFDPDELFLDYDFDNYLLSRAIVLPWLGMTFLYGTLMARRKFRQITRINYLPRMNSFEIWTYHTFSQKVDSYLVPV